MIQSIFSNLFAHMQHMCAQHIMYAWCNYAYCDAERRGSVGGEVTWDMNAESFSQWSQDEMNEPSHKGSKMQFDDWLDDEIKSHGDIPLSEWGYEEEHDEPEHQHAENFNAEDVYDNEADALKRAKELGCNEVHKHETDNGTVFMPCKTHEKYEDVLGAESFNAEEVAIAVEKTSGGDTLYGIKYLDLGYEHTEWFMSKTDRDLHLDMYVEGVYSHIHYNSAEGFEAESFNAENRPPSYMADADAHKLMEGAWRINSFVESEEEYPEWWKSRLSVVASTVDDLADYLDYSESEDFETETFSAPHHDPNSLEYNPTGICKTYTCRTEIGGMYEDSDAMRFKRFLEEYPKQFGIKNVRLKPQPEANIPLGSVYITFEICDDSEWSLVTDETGELYGHTDWGIKELKQRLDYDLNVAMRNDLDKYADLHRPIQTLAEGDEPNENWYMEAETFSAEAEGGMLYSKGEMPAGIGHYVWSVDSDEAGRYQVRRVGSEMTTAIPMKYFERIWDGQPSNRKNPSVSFEEPKEGEYHPYTLDFRYPKYMKKSNDPLKKGSKHQILLDANEWDWERFGKENPKLLRKLERKDGQLFYIFQNFDPSNYRYQTRRQGYRRA